LRETLEALALLGPDEKLPASVHEQRGINRQGKRVEYYFNYSGAEVSFRYEHAEGTNLLTGKQVAHDVGITLAPWDVAIIEESASTVSAEK
jgi:beta-galactosidase